MTWGYSYSTLVLKLVLRASQATFCFSQLHTHQYQVFCVLDTMFWVCLGLWAGKREKLWNDWVPDEPLLNRVYLKYSNTNRSQDTNIHLLLSFFFLQSPQAGTKDKTLCCWFCTSGPISLSAKIERKGYTPGNASFPSMCFISSIKLLVML